MRILDLSNVYSQPRGKRVRRLVTVLGRSLWVPLPRRYTMTRVVSFAEKVDPR